MTNRELEGLYLNNSLNISQLTDDGNITGFVVLTQTEYDALTPDPTTVYIIQGA